MKFSRLSVLLPSLLATTTSATTSPSINSTFYNPVLPGWHSDPSCVHVNSTFFCATSTFLVFPGLPIYASTDLLHWHLASHAWTRSDQFGAPKPALEVWRDANDPADPSCGFENFPDTVVREGVATAGGHRWVSSRPLPRGYWMQERQWRLRYEHEPGTVLAYECGDGDAAGARDQSDLIR